jgi:hypothetical protein
LHALTDQHDPTRRVSVSRFGRAAEIFGPIVEAIRREVMERRKDDKHTQYQAALRG